MGYDVEQCLVDLGATAESVVKGKLENKQYDCILIGAGVRKVDINFIMFEKLINVVHKFAPHSIICFNTKPSDTAEAVKRWV